MRVGDAPERGRFPGPLIPETPRRCARHGIARYHALDGVGIEIQGKRFGANLAFSMRPAVPTAAHVFRRADA